MENPLQVFKTVIAQLEQASGELAQKYDIKPLKGPQGKALYYLFKHQDEDIYIKDIEQRLHISKSVASNLVKRMERNGYLCLETSLEDKRYKRLVLTKKGISKIEPLEDFHVDLMTHLFAGISPDDASAVDRVLEQLQTNLKKYKEENDV